MELTQQQQRAVESIMGFFLNDETYFVLSGYAGTGKTTIVKSVLDSYQQELSILEMLDPSFENKFVYVTASTNKAVDVLQQQLAVYICRTTHSLLGLIPKGKNLEQVKEPPKDCIIIVDEASMLDTTMLDFIKNAAENYNNKFLFIGDPTQLPPVGMDYAPIFEQGYTQIELTEILRQDTGVLKDLSNALREQVLGNPMESIDIDGVEVLHVDRDTYKQMIVDDMTRPDWTDSDSKVLCYTNKMAIAMNRLVKTHVDGTHKFQKGDFAINNKAFYTEFLKLKTDALVYIEDVIHDITSFNTPGCYVFINGVRLFVPYDMNKRYELEALYEVEAKHNYYLIQRDWIDIRAAYACTVHKSQGSTYKTAYVDIYDIAKARRFNEDLFNRLLYVAVSRASQKVVFTGDV